MGQIASLRFWIVQCSQVPLAGIALLPLQAEWVRASTPLASRGFQLEFLAALGELTVTFAWLWQAAQSSPFRH